MSRADRTTELAVIGAGPAGYPAAFRAADLGMDVTLIDPEPNPGGVCLYRGCVPSKALLHVSRLLHEIERAPEWGVSCGDVRVDVERVRAWKNAVVDKLTKGVGYLCRQRGIDYVRGRAAFRDARTLTLELHEGGQETLAFERAVIATGSRAAWLPGLPDSPLVMSSERALDIEEVPERLLVVGGGYIGLELGQLYAALGSRVTVVEIMPELLSGADCDLVRPLAEAVKDQFEAIYLESKVVEIAEAGDGLVARLEGEAVQDKEQRFGRALIAVGRKPNSGTAGLENTGVEVDEQGFIKIDHQCRTAEPNLFAVGDVAGPPMLAHKGTHQGVVAAEAAAGKKTAFEPQAIPAVVFSDPEVAWTGLSETDAKRQGRKVSVARFPWGASARAVTIGRTDGVTKLILDPETQRVLGMGVAGAGAGELVGQGSIAIEMGAVAEDLALIIQPHPTLSETVMEAAESAVGQGLHFYSRRRT